MKIPKFKIIKLETWEEHNKFRMEYETLKLEVKKLEEIRLQLMHEKKILLQLLDIETQNTRMNKR